jgi:hypothetical protein
LPTWKCSYFAKKEEEVIYWTNPVDNCGLCVNWCDDICVHHEKLKDIGVNERFEEADTTDNDYNDNDVWDIAWNGGSYGE